MAFTFDKGFDIFKTGVELYSDKQKRDADALTAEKAIEFERLRLEQERLKLESQKAGNSNKLARLQKAVPLIIVGGVVIIGGIAAYFYFKKKKAN